MGWPLAFVAEGAFQNAAGSDMVLLSIARIEDRDRYASAISDLVGYMVPEE